MSADLFDLTGRVAVITGGSRGLGKEMALAFADREGIAVYLMARLDANGESATPLRLESRYNGAMAHYLQ